VCKGCGAPEASCSSTTHFTDSNVQERHCHGCYEMLMEACRSAGFTVQVGPTRPVCTCWLGLKPMEVEN
jgi:hypothetical protein